MSGSSYKQSFWSNDLFINPYSTCSFIEASMVEMEKGGVDLFLSI